MNRLTARYKMWKNSLYKWDSWIYNRHRNVKECDSWSQFIINDCIGDTAVFNSGGMFFKDFIPDVTVIEYSRCPVNVNGMLYLNNGLDLENKFNNLIMINPISLKYNSSIFDFLTNPGLSRAGLKPNLLSWLKPNGKIYLSTSDWHLYYDRLKFTVHDMVSYQLRELKKNNIHCEYLEISNVNSDIENGNIKLVLSVKTIYNTNIN